MKKASEASRSQDAAALAGDPQWADRYHRLSAEVAVLDFACKQLILHLQDEKAQAVVAAAVMGSRLAPTVGDSAMVRGLINEVRAHGDDLAFQLERPGCDSIFIATAAARLCQTLAALKQQVGG